jgi:hypothetical protein
MWGRTMPELKLVNANFPSVLEITHPRVTELKRENKMLREQAANLMLELTALIERAESLGTPNSR